MLEKVIRLVKKEFGFSDFNEVRDFFKKVINLFKQMNYAEFKSEQFHLYESQLDEYINQNIPVS